MVVLLNTLDVPVSDGYVLLSQVNRKCVGKRAPVLVRYGDVSMCMVCAGEYNTIKRKHHCRGCGIVRISRLLQINLT